MWCFGGANKCLCPQVLSKIFYISVLRWFFPRVFFFFFPSLLCFSCCDFSCSFLLCVCVVGSADVESFFSALPPLFRHIRYYAWWFFLFCVFSFLFVFFRAIITCCFFYVVLAVFVSRVVRPSFACLSPFLSYLFLHLTFNWQCLGCLPFACIFYCFDYVFFAGFCCTFFFGKKLSLTYLPIYRVSCSLGPSHALFSCPPLHINPLGPPKPLVGFHVPPTLCVRFLLCVPFGLRHGHRFTGSVQVCLPALLVCICECYIFF